MSSSRFYSTLAATETLEITLASLGNGNARESTALLNLNKYADVHIHVHFQLAAGVPASEQQVLIYAYGSEDGSHYTTPATGVDSDLVLVTPTTLSLIGAVEVRDNTGTPIFVSQPLSIASAFGWILPRKWGIVVANRSGRAFAASNCAASYSGAYQVVR